MSSTLKASRPSSTKHRASKSVKGKARALPEEPTLVEEVEDDEEKSDDEGVDEEGMERLMEALGKDGLDEYEQAQLQMLGGEGDEWETDEDALEGEVSEDDEVDGKEDGEENSDEEVEGSDVEKAIGGPNDDDEGEEEEHDVALDDVDDSVDEDAVPRQKIEIDNKVALERIRDTIQLDPSLPWTETLTVTYSETIDADVNDDLSRELAFYKQALHSANKARSLAAKHNFPFTRPSDYFAEMVKSDSHMERIRQRLLDESAGIKKGEEKRREREGKKFGKQVQIEKLKEREKSKKEMDERLKGLKRKRKGALDNVQADDDGFDVAVEDAISDHPSKRGKGAGGSKISRTSRDKKFGFGGAGKRSKQNDRASTDNFESGPGKGGRGGFHSRGRGGGRGSGRGGRGGGSKRPGKDKRISARSRT